MEHIDRHILTVLMMLSTLSHIHAASFYPSAPRAVGYKDNSDIKQLDSLVRSLIENKEVLKASEESTIPERQNRRNLFRPDKRPPQTQAQGKRTYEDESFVAAEDSHVNHLKNAFLELASSSLKVANAVDDFDEQSAELYSSQELSSYRKLSDIINSLQM